MRYAAEKALIPLVLALFLIPACAARQPQVGATLIEGVKTITMKADSFRFEPNNIRAATGDTLALNITNVSGTRHNFTIKDPAGVVMQSVDLPAGKTERVTLSFPQSGTYEFSCDRPLHSSFGMEGRIEVTPGS